MTTHDYTVASASQLTGASLPSSPEDDDTSPNSLKAMDGTVEDSSRLQRRSAVRRSVRFTPSTKENEEDESSESDIFPRQRNSSDRSRPSTSDIPKTQSNSTEQRDGLEMLMPARYSPQQNGSAEREFSPGVSSSSSSSNVSHVSVPERVKGFEAHVAPLNINKKHAHTKSELAIDTDVSHKRNASSSSTTSNSSRRGRKKGDIYFTPTEVTKSQIFLSSPKASPTMPDEQDMSLENGEEDEAGTRTPRASVSLERPRSAIYVGPGPSTSPARRKPENEKLRIAPLQLDQLVTGLVKSGTIQKHVRRHWWDAEDIPDDETMDSYTSVTTPTLTTASTLYSRPNENFLNGEFFTDTHPGIRARDFASIDGTSYGNKKLPPPPIDPGVPSGGVALADPAIHGSPIRYTSRTYRLGANVLSIGSCSFINVPYGTEVECSLRIEPPSNLTKTSKVMLQCVNQVVDRKTGKRAYLLSAEVDVTHAFEKAALAEFAQFAEKKREQIEVANTPTSAVMQDSPEIDWVALADELQLAAHVADTVENAILAFQSLDKETCSMQTLTLLSELDRIKDQHQDFLILKPTAYHQNGIPSNIRVPWVSSRLYHDWYEKEEGYGYSEAAKGFQRDVVEKVAKHSSMGEVFDVQVHWDREVLGVKGVPLSGSGGEDVWVCFIRGASELQG